MLDVLNKGLKILANGELAYLINNSPMPNIPFPTLGGEVFWDDLASYQGWCVQQNIFTSHCRVLDPDNWRFAWGSEEAIHNLFRMMVYCLDTSLSPKERNQAENQLRAALASGNYEVGPKGVYK